MGSRGPGHDVRAIEVGVSQHLAQGRSHEQLEGHHGGDRIAGQTEERPAVQRSERDGLAGPHGDAPQVQLGAQLFQRGAHEVQVAHRDARRRHEHVRVLDGPQPALDVVEIVGGDAEIDRLAADLDGLGHQRVGVGVRDLSRTGLLTEVGQLVPGREDGHPRPATHAHLRPAQGGQESHLGRTDHLARREHAVARTDVLAARPDERARLDRARDHDARGVGLDVLLGDDGIGAVRHGRPGEDADRRPRSDGAVGHGTRGHATHHGEPHRAAGWRVFGADSVAVHRGVRPRRDLARGHHRLGQHAIESRQKAHPLLGQHGHPSEDLLPSLLDRQHPCTVTRLRRKQSRSLSKQRRAPPPGRHAPGTGGLGPCRAPESSGASRSVTAAPGRSERWGAGALRGPP